MSSQLLVCRWVKVFFLVVGPLSKIPLFSINGENSPGSCYFMKYDILVQKVGFLYVKVYLWIFLLIRKQYFPKKKIRLFQPKNWGEKNCQNPYQAQTKKKKEKKSWPTDSLGVGAKPQWSDLKKKCVPSLREGVKTKIKAPPRTGFADF